jgi:glycosyltransferase involved in cell wall biosynthesis
VAPDGGGPATYVTRGDTGVLTQTWDVASLTGAIAEALDIAAERDESRAERSHDMVRDRFTIQGMASALGPVYAGVAREEAELIRAAGALG